MQGGAGEAAAGKFEAFNKEDSELLEEVAGYASLVMGSLERGRHKEDHLTYTQHLTALWHAFLKVRRGLGAPSISELLGTYRAVAAALGERLSCMPPASRATPVVR